MQLLSQPCLFQLEKKVIFSQNSLHISPPQYSQEPGSSAQQLKSSYYYLEQSQSQRLVSVNLAAGDDLMFFLVSHLLESE